MRKYYLVTTKHLEDGLWFRDDEDFVTGMNYVAIQAALTPEVIVLAFILMSNHVHFVLYGTRLEVEAFMNSFKGRFSHYLGRKYGIKEFLRRNNLDIKEISENEAEALERAIAYVQMNCVAASICLYPGQYPWGTGNTFFQVLWDGMPLESSMPQGGNIGSRHAAQKYRRLGDLSGRERIRLMHSRVALKLPDEWLLSETEMTKDYRMWVYSIAANRVARNVLIYDLEDKLRILNDPDAAYGPHYYALPWKKHYVVGIKIRRNGTLSRRVPEDDYCALSPKKREIIL